MSHLDLESLHEQASGHYLRGELDSAASAWERVLSFDPADERALEGVRLCRQMGQSTDLEPNDLGLGAGFEDDLDQLDFKLDLGGGQSPADGSPAEPPQGQESNDEFLDLSGLATDLGGEPVADSPHDLAGSGAFGTRESFGELNLDAGAAGPSGEMDASESSLWQWNPPDAPADPEGYGSLDTAAEVELRRRVNELLAKALVDIEENRKDEALTTLDRLLILDEENDAALALKGKLLEGDEGNADENADENDRMASADPQGYGSERVRVADLQSVPPDRRPVPAAPAQPASPAHAEAPRPALNRYRPPPKEVPRPVGEDSSPDDDDGVSMPSGAAAPRSAKRFSRNKSGTSRIRLVGLAVLGVALVGGAAWFVFGRAPIDEAPVAAEPAAPAPRSKKATQPSLAVLESGAAPAALAPEQKRDPAEMLRRGAAALAAEDYAGAVLIYGDLVRQDGDNAEAQRQLELASDGYREQRAAQEKWKLAFEAFDEQRFTEALRLFYRLPAGGDPARLERYKVNGWYNLGVLAMHSSDCKAAVPHFKEAETLRPRDGDVQAALELAETCGRSPSARAQVEALRLRMLED